MGFYGELLTHTQRLFIIHRREFNILVTELFQFVMFCVVLVIACVHNRTEEKESRKESINKYGIDSVKSMSLWYFPNNFEVLEAMENIVKRMKEANSREVHMKGFQLAKNVNAALERGNMTISIYPFIVEIQEYLINEKVAITLRMSRDLNDQDDFFPWYKLAALFLKTTYSEIIEKNFPHSTISVRFSAVKMPFLPQLQQILRQMMFFMSVCHGLVLVCFLGWERTQRIDEAIILLGGSHCAYILSWYLQAAIQSLVLSILYGISFYIILSALSTPLAFWELIITFFIFSNFVVASLITACLLFWSVKLSLFMCAIYHVTLYGVAVAHTKFDYEVAEFFIPHLVFRCPCPGLLCGADPGANFGDVFSCFKSQIICYIIFVLLGCLASYKHKLWRYPWIKAVHQEKWNIVDGPFHGEEFIFKICRRMSAKKKSVLPEDYVLFVPFMETTVLLDPLGTNRSSFLRTIMGRESLASERVYMDTKLKSPICMCPGYDFLLGQLTVKETLVIFNKFLAGPSEMRQQEFDLKTIAEEFNLTNKVNICVKTLSQTDKKLVMIAIAFLSSAKILILDDPMGPLSDHSLKVAISNIQRRKHLTTMILTCSSGEDALRIADRVAVICNSQLRIYGTVFFVARCLGVGTRVRIVKSNDANMRLYLYLWLFAPSIKCLSKLNCDIAPNMTCLNFFIARVDSSYVQFVVSNLRLRKKSFGIVELEVSDAGIDKVLDRCHHPLLLDAVIFVHSSTVPIIQNIKGKKFHQLQHWLSQKDNVVRYSKVDLNLKSRRRPSISSSATLVTTSKASASPTISEMSLTDFLRSTKHYHIGKVSSHSKNLNENRQKHFGGFNFAEEILNLNVTKRSHGKGERTKEHDNYLEINESCTYSNDMFLCGHNTSSFNLSKIVHLPNKLPQKEEKWKLESKWPNRFLNSNPPYSFLPHSIGLKSLKRNTSQSDENKYEMMEDEDICRPNSNVNNNGHHTSSDEDRNSQCIYYNMVMNGLLKDDLLPKTKHENWQSRVEDTDENDRFPLIWKHTKAVFLMSLWQYWSCLLFTILGFLTALIIVNVIFFATTDKHGFFMDKIQTVDLEESITGDANVYVYYPFHHNDFKPRNRYLNELYESRLRDLDTFDPLDMSGIPRDLNSIAIGATFLKKYYVRNGSTSITAHIYYTQGRGDAKLLSIITAMDTIQDYLNTKKKPKRKTIINMSINHMPMINRERSAYILDKTQAISTKTAIGVGIASCVLVFSITFGSMGKEANDFHDFLVLSGVNRLMLYWIELSIQVFLYHILMLFAFLSLAVQSPVKDTLNQLGIHGLTFLIWTTISFYYAVAVFSMISLMQRIFNRKMMTYIWMLVEGLALGLMCLAMILPLTTCQLYILVSIVGTLSPVGCQTSTFIYLLQHALWQLVRSHLPHTEMDSLTSLSCVKSMVHHVMFSILSHFVQSGFFFLIYIIFVLRGPIWIWVVSDSSRKWSLWTFPSVSNTEGPNNVSATVNPFGCLVILGSNETSGNEQLIRFMLGLNDLEQGEIEFQGHKLPKRLLSSSIQHLEIGYCPKENKLNPRLTGRQVLKLFAQIRNVPSSCLDWNNLNEMVNSMLRSTSLTDVADFQISKYSNNDKRKLHVAMAMIGSPKFLVLEYPTDGLDLLMKMQIWRMIDEYRQIGNTVVVSTDCAEEGLFLGTSVVVLNNRKVHFKTDVDELKDQTHGYFAYIWLRRNNRGKPTPIVSVIRQIQRRFHGGVFALVKGVRDPYIILSFINIIPDLDHGRIYDTLDELKETEVIRTFIVEAATQINLLDSLKYDWLPY